MRSLKLLAPLIVAVLVLAGCGEKLSVVKHGETEGVSVDVGGLSYQVQLSRFLNPNDVEDKHYLRGLPEGTELDPGGDAVWFAVFIRVKNPGDETLTPTSTFKITDSDENEFEPVEIDPEANPFVFVADPIPGAGVIPEPESPAYNGPIQGSLILFKVDTESLPHRPLVLHIVGADGDEAEVDLDL